MTPEQAKKFIEQKGQALAQWERLSVPRSSANAAIAKPFNEFDVALDELQAAYRNRMAVVMDGALASSSQDIHLEWLAAAQQLVERHASVLDFVERQRALCPPQSAQS